MPFTATLFDPAGRNPVGVSVRVIGRSLEVTGGGETLHIDPAKCSVTAGGWDGQAIQVAWPGEGGTWAVFSQDPTAREELGRVPALHAGLAAVSQAHRVSRRNGRLGALAAALLALLPVLALLGVLVFRDSVVDAVLKRIPITVDQEIGRMFESEALGSAEIVTDNEATRAVQLIVDRLRATDSNREFEFRVRVQRHADVNAFAAPGGLIVVYTGLIREAGSAEEVAGVLAHEMAHATRRHTMRQLIYAGGLIPLVGLLVGQRDAAALFQNLSQLTELKFSRLQEEDADRVGFETLVKARVSTEGLAAFFDRLARTGNAPPPFLSTHPSSANRAAEVRARTKTLEAPVVEPLAVDWEAVRAAIR